MTTQTHDATDWEGRPLLDRDGARIGTIEEVFLVQETGKPEWALVKRGLIGSRATLVPLAGATPGAEGIRATCEKGTVATAPPVDADDDPSDEQVAAVYRHYGLATHGSNGSSPSQAPQGSTLRRVVSEFSDDRLTHWAAALTYYAVLSIFPALLALVAILGLIGSSAIEPLLDNLGSVAPGPAKEILTNALNGLQDGGGGAGILFVVALAGAIWSASGYVSAFMDASNTIYDVQEGRSIWRKLPVRLGVTIVMLVLLAVSASAVVLTGPVAEQAGSLFGVGDSVLGVWDVAKWPALVLIAAFMFAVLYYASPNVKQPGIKAVLPGGVVAVVLWIVVSAAFALYVALFASYNKTYGALGGVIVFLVWLWLTNLAILLGAELNAERARARNIAAGHAPGEEPYLPVRARA
jgi:membrane protein